MLCSSTRKFLLATCVAAAPAYAIAQTPAQQNQPAQQQQTTQRSAQMSGKFLSAPQTGHMRAADLREADIYTEDNQKVGDIDDILLDRQGKIVAVVVGVGGFLGIGEKDVAIPFEALEIQDRAAASASADRGAARTTSTTTTTTTTGDRMATGNVPDNRAATDQDRQRATAQRAEQMSNEQAARQGAQQRTSDQRASEQQRQTTTTTREPAQRTAQATTAMWKPERILLKGVTKADLQNAPEFNWDETSASRSRSNTNNPPARNR